MPLYTYKCLECGGERDVLKKLIDIDKAEYCTRCDVTVASPQMVRKLAAPAVRGDYPPYQCPITSKVIEGRRAHEENLKRHGCRVLESGETAEVTRSRQSSDNSIEELVAESAAAEVATWSSEKQALLGKALESSEAGVVRNTAQGSITANLS